MACHQLIEWFGRGGKGEFFWQGISFNIVGSDSKNIKKERPPSGARGIPSVGNAEPLPIRSTR